MDAGHAASGRVSRRHALTVAAGLAGAVGLGLALPGDEAAAAELPQELQWSPMDTEQHQYIRQIAADPSSLFALTTDHVLWRGKYADGAGTWDPVAELPADTRLITAGPGEVYMLLEDGTLYYMGYSGARGLGSAQHIPTHFVAVQVAADGHGGLFALADDGVLWHQPVDRPGSRWSQVGSARPTCKLAAARPPDPRRVGHATGQRLGTVCLLDSGKYLWRGDEYPDRDGRATIAWVRPSGDPFGWRVPNVAEIAATRHSTDHSVRLYALTFDHGLWQAVIG